MAWFFSCWALCSLYLLRLLDEAWGGGRGVEKTSFTTCEVWKLEASPMEISVWESSHSSLSAAHPYLLQCRLPGGPMWYIPRSLGKCMSHWRRCHRRWEDPTLTWAAQERQCMLHPHACVRCSDAPGIWCLCGSHWPSDLAADTLHTLLVSYLSWAVLCGPTWKKKDCSICSLHFENYVTFTLTIQNCVANFCDKHPKSKSCELLFGWCRCFRAYCLTTMEWNVKRIVPGKRWENFLSVTYLCVLTLLLF